MAGSALSCLLPARPPAFKQSPSSVPALGTGAKKRRHGDEDMYYMHVSVRPAEPRLAAGQTLGPPGSPERPVTLRAETGLCRWQGHEGRADGRTQGERTLPSEGLRPQLQAWSQPVDDAAPGGGGRGRALGTLPAPQSRSGRLLTVTHGDTSIP